MRKARLPRGVAWRGVAWGNGVRWCGGQELAAAPAAALAAAAARVCSRRVSSEHSLNEFVQFSTHICTKLNLSFYSQFLCTVFV